MREPTTEDLYLLLRRARAETPVMSDEEREQRMLLLAKFIGVCVVTDIIMHVLKDAGMLEGRKG